MIAPPLRLHDCSLVLRRRRGSRHYRDGHREEVGKRAVEIAGIGHITERIAINVRPNMYTLMGAKEAAHVAYREAGISASDIDVAEVHDCFTINQILCTEALGLSKTAMGGRITWTEGSRGTTRSALTSPADSRQRDTPSGRPGPSMHALLFKQLVGEPIGWLPSGELLRSEPF
jgi:acetyl-CoA C-acetyltransferase